MNLATLGLVASVFTPYATALEDATLAPSIREARFNNPKNTAS